MGVSEAEQNWNATHGTEAFVGGIVAGGATITAPIWLPWLRWLAKPAAGPSLAFGAGFWGTVQPVHEWAWTEESARTTLYAQIREWEGAGVVLAPHLLRHFLEGKGTPFTYTPQDEAEIRKEAAPMIRALIIEALKRQRDQLNRSCADGPTSGKIQPFSSEVRWISTGVLLGLPQQIAVLLKGENAALVQAKEALFLGYGGAIMSVDGVYQNLRYTPLFAGVVDVKVTVTITDHWTFGKTSDVPLIGGLVRERMFAAAYAAGRYLELNYPGKYPVFKHSIRLDDIVLRDILIP
jgi:hypothetical protein